MPKPLRDDLQRLISKYPQALSEHGVTPQGVLWPNAADLATRFRVLLSALLESLASSDEPQCLLDLGCGPGFLLDYLHANGLLERITYTGVDVSETTIAHARQRWPTQRFELRDIRDTPFEADQFDHCIMCGVFTARFGNSYVDMRSLAQATLEAAWPSMRRSLSFNVMSKHVDWEREDLFHWPLDEIMAFCKARISRHVAMRLDYGLWEAAIMISREPKLDAGAVPAAWSDSGA